MARASGFCSAPVKMADASSSAPGKPEPGASARAGEAADQQDPVVPSETSTDTGGGATSRLVETRPSDRAPETAVPGTTEAHVLEEVRRLTDVSLAYLSLEELLSELLERIREGLGADTAAILLLDPDRGVLLARAARGIEEEVRQGVRVPLGRGFAGRIAAERRPIAIEDLDHADVVNPLLRERGIRSLLGVPLLVEGRAIGVMHVGTLHLRRFGPTDVRLLSLAAERAAAAIGNAELTEQRALTEMLQRTLLPTLPSVPGMRLTAKYLPAQTGLKLGGDWYDVFALPDGRVAFVIGDVVGHGIAAAAVMAEIRSALRAYTVEGHRPLEVILRLDEMLRALAPPHSATVAIFALDFERELVCAVSAGHLPALLLEPDGTHRFVAYASGPPLGFGLGSRYEEEDLPFSPGSSLLLYTDGLIERRESPLELGLDQLVAAATEPTALEGSEDAALTLADRVYARLAREARLEDDVALLAIEALLVGERLCFTLEASPRTLASFRRAINHWLAHHGLDAEERMDVVLACSEAAGNVIEHANGPVNAGFEVDCHCIDGELRISIKDSGTWRPEGTHGRGRGLGIMRHVMDDVEIVRGRDGTTLTLVKRVTSR